MFGSIKTRKDKTRQKKCQQNLCHRHKTCIDAFFVLFTRNTLTYSTLRFCPDASNNGVNLIQFFFHIVFLYPKCVKKKEKMIYRKKKKKSIIKRFFDAFHSKYLIRRPFSSKNCGSRIKCWQTTCLLMQLTYVFGWIWSPSALVHRKSLIKSLFSTFPWHVITWDLPTGKRIGACGGVIRRWGLSQLTLSGIENKHKRMNIKILFELQTNWINTFMSTILGKFSKQNAIQRK